MIGIVPGSGRGRGWCGAKHEEAVRPLGVHASTVYVQTPITHRHFRWAMMGAIMGTMMKPKPEAGGECEESRG